MRRQTRRHIAVTFIIIYAVRTSYRNALQRSVEAQGIETGIHYPVPVHLQPAYADLGYKPGDFPQSERTAKEVLSLPMFAELTAEMQELVAKLVRDAQRVR